MPRWNKPYLQAIAWASCAVALLAVGHDPTRGALRVAVRDAQTHAPLILTNVTIYGARSLRGQSGLGGALTFSDLPPGAYEIVASRSGFIENIVRDIRVGADTTSITVTMSREPRKPPAWLRTIARITARPSAKSSTTHASADAPEAKMTGSMVSALQTLPNVTLAGGGGFSQYASLGGHPIAQTAASIEGVPVGGFGSAVDLQPFNLDLFSSVNITQKSAYGASGGTIDFSAPDPTLDWIGRATAVEGAFGNAGLSITERGTSGRLGVVAALAARDQGTPLDGMRFLDASGLNYTHDALARTAGTIVKARYPFSLNNVLFGSYTSIASTVPLVCAVFTGFTPCGYGPHNQQQNVLTSAQLRDAIDRGRLSATVTLFHNHLSNVVDQGGRYVRGVHLPQSSADEGVANGLLAEGQVQVGRGYPIDFAFASDRQTNRTTGSAFGTIVPAVRQSLTYTSASLSAPLFKRRHVSSDLSLGVERQGGGSHANERLALTYAPTSVDRYAFAYATGLQSGPAVAFSGIADPASLQIDCNGRNAVGLGPSSPGGNSHNTRLELTWSHAGRKLASSFALHHESDADVPILAFVSGSALDPALFPASYLAAVHDNVNATCGAAARPFGVADLFYQVNQPASRVDYDGAEFNFHLDASRNVSADLSYGVMHARAYGSGGILFSPGSTVRSGMQLPNQPWQTANLSVIAALGRAGVKAMANVRYVSRNNPNNLPSYAVLDAGLEVPVNRGTILADLTNATGTWAGVFTGGRGAIPLATGSGMFATLATPLAPRSLNVSWSIPFGFGAQLSDVPNYDPGPGAYGFKLYPYPNTPAPDPLAMDRRSGRCGPEAVAGATKFLGIIRAYVALIELVRSRTGAYPATFADLDTEGLRATYRRNGTSFALLVSTDKNISWDDRLTVLKPLTGCARIYSGFLPETRRRNLYIPPYDEQQSVMPVFDYAPEIGFYYPPSVVENESLFPSYVPVPKVAPSNPFAIASGPACPSQVRDAAEAFVTLLKPVVAAFYSDNARPPLPEGFSVTRHRARDATWLEITSDAISVKLLAPCLAIVGAGRDSLNGLGLDGTRIPTIDYTPRLGFYNLW